MDIVFTKDIFLITKRLKNQPHALSKLTSFPL